MSRRWPRHGRRRWPGPSGSSAGGARTASGPRHAILDAAARLATVEGLDGLSHRASGARRRRDEQERPLRPLRLEGGAPARDDRDRRGDLPTPRCSTRAGRPEGLRRLRALCERFLAHVERRVFPGGCFFASAAAELDTRPGPLRDRIAEVYDGWIALLEGSVLRAQELGQLDRRPLDPEQLAFEVTPCSPRPTASSCCAGIRGPSGWRAARSARGCSRAAPVDSGGEPLTAVAVCTSRDDDGIRRAARRSPTASSWGAAWRDCPARTTWRGAGRSVHVVEAEEAPGGRARTVWHRGRPVDRGFQVLLPGLSAHQGPAAPRSGSPGAICAPSGAGRCSSTATGTHRLGTSRLAVARFTGPAPPDRAKLMRLAGSRWPRAAAIAARRSADAG